MQGQKGLGLSAEQKCLVLHKINNSYLRNRARKAILRVGGLMTRTDFLLLSSSTGTQCSALASVRCSLGSRGAQEHHSTWPAAPAGSVPGTGQDQFCSGLWNLTRSQLKLISVAGYPCCLLRWSVTGTSPGFRLFCFLSIYSAEALQAQRHEPSSGFVVRFLPAQDKHQTIRGYSAAPPMLSGAHTICLCFCLWLFPEE